MGGSRYRELGPERLPAPVRALVECAWRAEVPAGAAPHEQRVLPDGCMDLLLAGGRIVVAGPDTAAHVARSAPGSATVGLRFRPGALPALLGVAADAVRDHRVDLADLLPPRRPGTTPAGRNALLDTTTALLSASEQDHRRLPDPLPTAALRALVAGMSAAEVADRVGVTTRTLHRRCLATLGYGPSVARRVLRFRRATGLLYAGVPPAEVAARAGYADQPHLSREVRALAGVSPTELVPAARQEPGAPTQANRSSDEPSGSVTVA